MRCRTKPSKIAGLTTLVCFCCVLNAVVTAGARGDVLIETRREFPYRARITGNNVYIRSGPGESYYFCGKLNKGDIVQVVGSKFSWSRILPPPGSFSWIAKSFVRVDPGDQSTGTVTGDAVRVYAGSDYLKSIRAEKLQLKLNKGHKVRILGVEEDKTEYYKIEPPQGAYLWVKTIYTEPVEGGKGAAKEQPAARPQPEVKPAEAVADLIVPDETATESDRLKLFQKLQKLIKTEKAKPLERQNYAAIKQAMLKLAAGKDDKAARYARFEAQRIERFELALEVAKQLRLQETQRQKTRKQIESALQAKLAQVPDLGRFAVMGKLAKSNIFTVETKPALYRVLDDAGKTLCYALPAEAAAGMDLSRFLDKKVGLVGTIEPHRETESALVKFTEVVPLEPGSKDNR